MAHAQPFYFAKFGLTRKSSSSTSETLCIIQSNSRFHPFTAKNNESDKNLDTFRRKEIPNSVSFRFVS